jgi:hypothetical protein
MNDRSIRIYAILSEDAHHPAVQPKDDDCRQVSEQDTLGLRTQELTAGYKLTHKQASTREKLVATMLESGRRYLELRDKTVEMAIRLFDLYCLRLAEGVVFEEGKLGRLEKGRNLLERKDEAHLSLVACLFSCSKYHEIYPPSLSDFLFISGDKHTKGEVIRREIDVLHITEFGFEVSCISRWFEHYFTSALPPWTNDCYLKCYGRMEELARVVWELARSEAEAPLTIASRVGMAQKALMLLNEREDKGGACRTDKPSK